MNKQRKRLSFIELLIAVVIILILAAIAITKRILIHNGTLARELAAIQQIRSVETMQRQYYSQYGKYATQLTELGPPASGQPGPTASDLIPGDLAAGKKSGFIFTLTGSPTGYVINVHPETYNSTGRRSFYSDHSLVVRQNLGPEPATVQSPELK